MRRGPEGMGGTARRGLADLWWAGRVAVVVGASSGIGLATAHALHARGARVVLMARSAERLAGIAASWGEGALAVPVDVRDRAEVERQIAAVAAECGRIDILVYCAGILYLLLADELDERLRDMVETNLLGAAWVTRAVLPWMRAARFGRIVYVGSVAGHIATVGHAGYAMTKWGLRALAQALRAELDGSGIRVSLVSPYYVRTPMLDGELAAGPLPGYAPSADLEAPQVAEAVLRAARSGARELILAPWPVRLGLLLGQLLPGLRDRVIARMGRPLIEHRRRLVREPGR